MFGFFKDKLTKIYHSLTSKLFSLFSKKIDADAIIELKKILLESDTGVALTNKIIKEVEARYQADQLKEGQQLKELLQHVLLDAVALPYDMSARVFVLVGINGSGKTTFAAKLAHFYQQQGKKVLLVAADTFRAAAVEQLKEWATRTKSDVIFGEPNQDPASVVFKGTQEFSTGKHDILIVDTAGRLQTKSHLMQELSKVKKVIQKNLPNEKIFTLLTIDSMLGQNSFDQAKVFNEATDVSGIVLTKLDGTGKGGIVFAISQELQLPVAFISYGETMDSMALFDAREFVDKVLSE